MLTHLEIHCSSSKEGIENLRREYQSHNSANGELQKTNIWLDSEDEIMEKVPPFTRDQVEVTLDR